MALEGLTPAPLPTSSPLFSSPRGRERDRELETSMREKHRSAASCTPPTGDVPTTKIHALDWNRTWDPSVRRPTLYPLSQTVSFNNALSVLVYRSFTSFVKFISRAHITECSQVPMSERLVHLFY
ncbi:hypothetical protein QTO34_005102 [Cnephaeus nilssonii]|uniref:Uncharacterized protein n=1 Tax=Cnephaeus nilssonii TaxID=3371016 RepID=A0AA40HMS8_CNENI|nr:hypothetical protein QTO34_005102 [Eptesicus nilssonii]